MPETNHVSSKQIAPRENAITSPQKTIIISPMVNGTNNQPPPPLAKSKFRLTISRPSPDRPTLQPNGPEDGTGQPKVSAEQPAVTQNQSMSPIMVETSVEKENSIQNQAVPAIAPTDDVSLSETKDIDGEISSPKAKETSIFQRFFKPEKKVQFEEATPAEVPINQAVVVTINQNGTLQSVPESEDLQVQSPAAGQEIATAEDDRTSPAADIHPVMSFFKTLVNKPLPKSEEEVKSDAGDKKKANGGLRKSSSKEKGRGPVQQAAKSEVTGQKKSESPKGGTLGRLFRSKSKKEEQTSGDKIPATVDEGKSAKEDTPRPRLFWRKASAETSPQPSKGDSGAKPGAAADSKSQEGKKAEEGKNAKPKIMMFFKQLSVMGDPSSAASEEGNEKSNNSPTLDITDGVEIGKSEKTVTAVVEPPPAPPLKIKDNPKDKKGSSEKLTKQESRESPEAAASSQMQAPEPAPALNGAEPSRESQLKRTEKRQSLGSFFKAIGPKRLCDAEVQTDPVSILPAEKAK